VLAPPKAEQLPLGLTGIADAPVRALTSGDGGAMEAWVATIDNSTLRARGRALARQALVHNEVVNAALGTGRTPAPARYGSHFADDAACIADLARRSNELMTILARIAGAVEMPVLIVPLHAAVPPMSSTPDSNEPAAGRRYLEALRSRARDEEERRTVAMAEAERISGVVRGFVRDEVRSVASSGRVTVAHLVPLASVEVYRKTLSGLSPGDVFRFIVGEPRAPYSFTSPQED